MLEVTIIATAGITIDTLVGTHHLGHFALLHERFESREVGFPQVAFREVFYVKGVAVPFGT